MVKTCKICDKNLTYTKKFCSRICYGKYLSLNKISNSKGKTWIIKDKSKMFGHVVWNKGKTGVQKGYWKNKERPEISGENNYQWIADRMLLKDDHKDRGGQLHRDWSRRVKNRDNWKCKVSNQDCEGRMEAHHILGWSEHPELRYELNNGITLCQAHHPRKRAEEKLLVPKFKELIGIARV